MAFMRQAGQSKKMGKARLSFVKRKTVTILIQFFFTFSKCVYLFGTLCMSAMNVKYWSVQTGLVWREGEDDTCASPQL
jgi:hypothetical protein